MSCVGPVGWLLPGRFPRGPGGRSFRWQSGKALEQSGKRIKVKKRLRTDGKSRQELSFDRCQEISLEVPLLCWSSCFAFHFPSARPLQPLGDVWK